MVVQEKVLHVPHPLGKDEAIFATLLNTDLGDTLVIRKDESSKISSNIMAAISHYIPLIVKEFGLSIDTAEIVYTDTAKDDQQDDKFYRLLFAREIKTRTQQNSIVSYVTMLEPQIEPLTKIMAQKLEEAGLEMTKYNGHRVVLRTLSLGDVKGKVEGYDGNQYIIQPDNSMNPVSVSGDIRKSLN